MKHVLPFIRGHRASSVICLALFVGAVAFFAGDGGGYTIKNFLTPPTPYDNYTSPSGAMEFSEPNRLGFKDVTIHFEMNAYFFHLYDNIFQTSNINNGLRLEETLPDKLVLYEGGEKLKAIEVIQQLQTGKWYSITIHLHKSGQLQMFVDDAEVLNMAVNPRTTHVDRIMIGAGYSGQRRFDGRIRNFSVDYTFFGRHFKKLYLFMAFCFALIALAERAPVGRFIRDACSSLAGNCRAVKYNALSRDVKITTSMAIILVGFISILYFYYHKAFILGQPFPDNTFLPSPVDRFCDFFATVGQWYDHGFHGTGYGLSYFPSTYLIVSIFSSFYAPVPMRAIIVFSIVFFSFCAAYAFVNLKSQSKAETFLRVFIFTCMAYPVLFILHAGNFEAFIFMFLCLFISLYRRGRTALSTIPLAMAISMKLFPAVFLVLFIADKKYRELLYTIIAGVFFTLLPLLLFDGGIRDGVQPYLQHLRDSQKMYFDLMIMSQAGEFYGHSLLNSARILAGRHFPSMETVLMPYFVFSLVFFAVVSSYIMFIERVFWKRIALIVICLCLLPYTSTDYKLIHFFIPLFLFINHTPEEHASHRFDILYITLLSMLLVPKNYFGFHGLLLLNINNVLNTGMMIAILASIIASGLQDEGLHRGFIRMRNWFGPALR